MELRGTRREILRALVGGAVASGCRVKPEIHNFDGGYVLEHMAGRGHQLRDRAALGTEVRHPKTKVLILGAGVAGLTAAWRLARHHGQSDLAILELMDEPGGTSGAGQSEVTRYPWGAHYLPAPRLQEQPELIQLLDEVGVTRGRTKDGHPIYREQYLVADPQERLHYRGSWYEGQYPAVAQSSADQEQRQRFLALIDRFVETRDAEGRRAFCLPLARSADTPALRDLDNKPFSVWLDDNGFDSPRLRWWVRLACRDDYGQPPERVSAWYGLHYFAARTPTTDSSSAPFLTWPEGNRFLIRALAKPVKDKLHGGHTVMAIENLVGEVRVTTLDAKQKTHVWSADRCVFALPSFLRPYLLKEAPVWDANPNPWLVANLHVKSPPREAAYPPAWDNVLYEGRGLGYVRSTHQIPWHRGASVWTHYLPVDELVPTDARKALYGLSYRDAADAVVSELTRAHGDLRRHLTRVDIRRYGHAMATPAPGTRFSQQRLRAMDPFDRVHFAHTDLSGVALFEEAFFHGSRAAAEVASRLVPA